eukprot:1675818-Rhodomonas_salina.1
MGLGESPMGTWGIPKKSPEGACQTRCVKRLALFITFQFQVQANLHRNNPMNAMSPWCWWCLQRGRRHRETMTHFLCVCPQFDDARTRAGRIFSEGVSAAIEDELGE